MDDTHCVRPYVFWGVMSHVEHRTKKQNNFLGLRYAMLYSTLEGLKSYELGIFFNLYQKVKPTSLPHFNSYDKFRNTNGQKRLLWGSARNKSFIFLKKKLT